jgi:hypothetical protein
VSEKLLLFCLNQKAMRFITKHHFSSKDSESSEKTCLNVGRKVNSSILAPDQEMVGSNTIDESA